MNYWLINNGEPAGPYTEKQLRELAPDSSTPVWREGLNDWVTLAELPEYDDIFVVVIEESQLPPPLPRIEPTPVFPDSYNGYNGSNIPDVGHFAPSYLGWSIAVTLLCCIPLGIVAIFMSLRVNALNIQGDYDAAQRVSRRTELWIISAVTLGLVSAPFMVMFQMLSMA